MTWIPFGGQHTPTATEGFSLKWKNAQKNEKNNIASEIKNNQNPIFNPFCTGSVWYPFPDSKTIIKNQLIITNVNPIAAIWNTKVFQRMIFSISEICK